MTLRCPTCTGMGWRHIGWGGQEPHPGMPDGTATCDVLLRIDVRCDRCAGTGVYVSRARAGLATA